MAALPERFDPIGGHPICGKEKLGLENADANLYQDAPFVVTALERTTDSAKSAHSTDHFGHWCACRSKWLPKIMIVPLPSQVICRFLFRLPWCSARPRNLLPSLAPASAPPAAWQGHPPHMTMGILQSNRENILNAIQAFRSSLNQIESVLQNENYPQLELSSINRVLLTSH